MATRQITDIKFLYTRDDGNDQLYAQRTYIDTASGIVLTPVTPLFISRQVSNDTKVERPKEYDRRHVLSYIDNPNVATGVSEMKLAIPFAPGDVNNAAQLREILTLPRVLCIDYFGENRRDA